MTNRPRTVPELVSVLIDAGCDMCAVGSGYCINEPFEEHAASKVNEILLDFGPRLHLVETISAHLRTMGRYLDPGELPLH
jgi:hypothetical protein